MLADGNEIPLVGLGVWQMPNGPECVNAVRWALELGYRHIDTAQAYGNEESVGKGLRESGVPREEVFVTTKFYPASGGSGRGGRAQPASGSAVDRVDLYIVHWPEGGPSWAWPGMERARELGYARSIGVSNFGAESFGSCSRPRRFRRWWTRCSSARTSTGRRCSSGAGERDRAGGIQPAGHWPPLGSDAVARIAGASGARPPRCCCAGASSGGIPVIPKSSHRERIAENAQIFDFALTDEDIAQLDAARPYRRHGTRARTQVVAS